MDIFLSLSLITSGTIFFVGLYKEIGKIYCDSCDSVKVFCLMLGCVATLSLGFICLCTSFF